MTVCLRMDPTHSEVQEEVELKEEVEAKEEVELKEGVEAKEEVGVEVKEEVDEVENRDEEEDKEKLAEEEVEEGSEEVGDDDLETFGDTAGELFGEEETGVDCFICGEEAKYPQVQGSSWTMDSSTTYLDSGLHCTAPPAGSLSALCLSGLCCRDRGQGGKDTLCQVTTARMSGDG